MSIVTVDTADAFVAEEKSPRGYTPMVAGLHHPSVCLASEAQGLNIEPDHHLGLHSSYLGDESLCTAGCYHLMAASHSISANAIVVVACVGGLRHNIDGLMICLSRFGGGMYMGMLTRSHACH